MDADLKPIKLNEKAAQFMREKETARNIAIQDFQTAMAGIGSAMGIDNKLYILNTDEMTWVPRPKTEEKKNV